MMTVGNGGTSPFTLSLGTR